MTVDYDRYAETFSRSRKNMKWEEIRYFFSKMEDGNILDIGSGSGRLILEYREYFNKDIDTYLGIDLSSELVEISKQEFPQYNFIQGNMLDVISLSQKQTYKNIFLIASFHHLKNLEDRVDFMKSLYSILDDNGMIYMTNWDLLSSKNIDKYGSSCIGESINKFGSKDFNIKIGDSMRYYHSFSLGELSYIVKESGFKVVENRQFDGKKNIITILKK